MLRRLRYWLNHCNYGHLENSDHSLELIVKINAEKKLAEIELEKSKRSYQEAESEYKDTLEFGRRIEANEAFFTIKTKLYVISEAGSLLEELESIHHGAGTGIQCPVCGRRTNLFLTGRTFCRFISPLTEAGVFSAIMIKTMCMYSPVNDFQQGRPFLHGASLQQQVRRIRGYSLYPTLVIKSAVVAASFAWFSMFFFNGPPMII